MRIESLQEVNNKYKVKQDKIIKAKERRSLIKNILKDDDEGLKILRKLDYSALNYVNASIKFETYLKRLRDCERWTEDSTKEMERFWSNQHSSHNKLLSNLNLLNNYLYRNYCEKIPEGGIYPFKPLDSITDRNCVADWTKYYVSGFKFQKENYLPH